MVDKNKVREKNLKMHLNVLFFKFLGSIISIIIMLINFIAFFELIRESDKVLYWIYFALMDTFWFFVYNRIILVFFRRFKKRNIYEKKIIWNRIKMIIYLIITIIFDVIMSKTMQPEGILQLNALFFFVYIISIIFLCIFCNILKDQNTKFLNILITGLDDFTNEL